MSQLVGHTASFNVQLTHNIEVFVPLRRMPLNPNGKIDKPALPFPDTAEAASAESRTGGHVIQEMSSTEKAIQSIWASILPNAPSPIPIEESFFDLGGHSILATRLIFEFRKAFVISAPLSLVFDYTTIQEQARELDQLRNSDLGLATDDPSLKASRDQEKGSSAKRTNSVGEYANDYESLLVQLRREYAPLPNDFDSRHLTVFLTGATGFLGAFILRDLLSRSERVSKVICHVRAADAEKGLARLREGAVDRGVWDDQWLKDSRLEVVVGDLAKGNFGLEKSEFMRVADESDVIVHNGALVCLCCQVCRIN